MGIIGIGSFGRIGTQLAKFMGYTILAVDDKQDVLYFVNLVTHKPVVSVMASDLADKVLD
jgi:D-arabinose 1-dehydrogenase-like Zn-dependent alcohol dehydrogenase